MEDIPRDLRKNMTSFRSPTSKTRSPQWALLLIGNRGKVIRLGNIRMIAFILGISFFVVLSVTTLFFFLYAHEKRSATTLQQALSVSEQQLIPLRDEKDILMARLAMADAQIEVLRSRTKRLQGGPDGNGDHETEKKVDQDKQIAESISIEEFKAFYHTDRQELEIGFRVNNILNTNEPVSGFIFVAFSEGKIPDKDSLIIPAVEMSNGLPVDIDRGRYFMISHFNEIRFKTTVQSKPEHFKYAVIFIFSHTGDLLLEKTYPFQIEDESPDLFNE